MSRKNWVETTLDEIAEINPSLDKSDLSDDLLVSFVPMPSVQAKTGKINLTETRKLSEVKKGFTSFQKNDVLFAKITPCMENGKMAIVPSLLNNVGFGSTEFHVLRPRPGVNPAFIYYFVSSDKFRSDAEHNMTGAVGQRRVPTQYLKNHPISIPPLNEQCRIVAKIEELFDEIDKGIERLKKTKELLKEYRQSLLKSAFEGKLTEEWRAKNSEKQKEPSEIQEFIRYNHNKHHHYKNKTNSKKLKNLSLMTIEDLEVLPKLPHNWVWDRLGWVTLGVEYGTSAKSCKDGNVAVLRMGNIQNGILSWDDLVFSSDTNEITKYSLKSGDVLFNRTNSPELVGKTAIYLGEQPAIFAGYLIRINHIESVINGRYLTYYLNSPIAKQHGNRVKTDGVNQSNINGEKLINYPLPLCTLEEQNTITNILENHLFIADEVESEVKKAFDQANVLKRLILQKAFSGSLVQKNENDEPANKLLERIRAEKESSIKPIKKSKQRHKVTV